MSDPYYDQLVSSGKLRAAEIYLATLAKSGMSVATLVALDSPPDQKIIKIHCGKLSCRESILMPRSGAHQWFCDTHQVSGPVAVANTEMAPRQLRREKTQVRWKGRIYTAHYIGDDGVAFKLKNGNTVNLDPSRVEWV